MTREDRTKWTAALLLGGYKQGKGFLRNEKNEYCCLGVLCDINKVEWAQDERGSNSPLFANHTIENAEGVKTVLSQSRRVLPETLMKKLGMQHKDPSINLTDENFKHLALLGFKIRFPEVTLAELNDIGVPFKEMAAIIREHIRVID